MQSAPSNQSSRADRQVGAETSIVSDMWLQDDVPLDDGDLDDEERSVMSSMKTLRPTAKAQFMQDGHGGPGGFDHMFTEKLMGVMNQQVNQKLGDHTALKDVLGPAPQVARLGHFPAFPSPCGKRKSDKHETSVCASPMSQLSTSVEDARLHDFFETSSQEGSGIFDKGEIENSAGEIDSREWDEIDGQIGNVAAWQRGDFLRDKISKMVRESVVNKLRHAIKLVASDGTKGFNLEKLFRKMDVDHSGSLDYAEFERAVRRHLKLNHKDAPAADLSEIFKVLSSISDNLLLVDTLFEFAVTQEEYLEKYRSARILYLKQEIDETRCQRKEFVLKFQGNPKMRGQLDAMSLNLECWESQLLKLKKGVAQNKSKRGVAIPRTEDIPEDVIQHIRKKIKAALYTQEKGYSLDNLKSKLGKDASGMSVRQMRTVLRRTCRLEISDAHLSLIFHTMDKDASGHVDAEKIADFAMDERSTSPSRQITQAIPCDVDANEDCEQELDDPLKDAYAQDQLAEAYTAERQKTAQMLSGFIRILKQSFGCLREAFARIDTDDEHHITYNKLKECLERYQVPWQEAAGSNNLRSIFRALDINGIGLVTIGELMSALDVVQDEPKELEDLSPQARHTFLRKEFRDMTCKTKFWSMRGPAADSANRKLFDKAREEDCLPQRPRDEKRTEPLDNHRMGRDGPVRQRKLEQAYQEGLEKKIEQEISSVSDAPLITEKSRILAKQHETAAEGTRKGISGGAILEEVAQCTFMPQISPRSNALCRRHERGLPQRDGKCHNDMWHMRLAEQPGINDRLNSNVGEVVEERLEGHHFAPQISAKAKKLHASRERQVDGSTPFHHRLFHGGQFTEMAKHVRAAEKDTQPKGLFP